MKAKWIPIAIIAVLVLTLVALVVGNMILKSPGVRAFGGDLYANVSGVAYAFNEKTGEFVDSGTVTVKGCTEGDDYFVGELYTQSFPLADSGEISGEPTVTEADGFYCIEYQPFCTHMATTEDGEREYPYKHACNYSYAYYVYPEKPEFLAVLVYDAAEMDYYVAVIADNQAEAESQFAWFKENQPSLYD